MFDYLPPLVTAGDLVGMRGAPFSDDDVRAAGDAVRVACGWHVAPLVTEVVELDSDGARVLMLPSLHVESVTLVEDVTGDTPVVLTGWRVSRKGMLWRSSWPCGFSAVRVSFTHGWESCPAALMGAVASNARQRVVQESLGSRSVTLADAPESASYDSVVGAFRLGSRP